MYSEVGSIDGRCDYRACLRSGAHYAATGDFRRELHAFISFLPSRRLFPFFSISESKHAGAYPTPLPLISGAGCSIMAAAVKGFTFGKAPAFPKNLYGKNDGHTAQVSKNGLGS